MKHSYLPISQTSAPVYKFLFIAFGLFLSILVQGQSSLYFHHPTLLEGQPGQVGALYRFTGVIRASNGMPLTDCLVRIESLSQGMELLSIDQQDSPQEAAFQPVVEHTSSIGASAVGFGFEFIPHDSTVSADGQYVFPALIAALSGLKGWEDAQAFAECSIGKFGKVWVNPHQKEVMVARSGEAFRAQYKWGAGGGLENKNTPILFGNREVSRFKLKLGINSRSFPFKGQSVYEITMSESVPAGMGYETVHFASLGLSEQPLPEWVPSEGPENEIEREPALRKMRLSDNLLVFIPDEMVGKKVVVDIYTEAGELRRKIIEDKAPAQLNIQVADLSGGTYKLEIQSDQKKFSMITIRPSAS